MDLNFALFIFSFDMDYETKLWLVMIFFFSATYMQYYCVVGKPQVPCLFIFGDSLSDSGNNNNLHTDAKVNNLPYGIDFPLGPTGRFTNGRTSVDIISNNSILHICIFLSHGHVIFNFVTSSFLDYRCKNVLPVLPVIDLFWIIFFTEISSFFHKKTRIWILVNESKLNSNKTNNDFVTLSLITWKE